MEERNVLVTRPIPEAGLRLVQAACTTTVRGDDAPPSYGELLELVRWRDGLLVLLTDPIDAAIMDAAGPQLKVISTMAVGYDNIDIAAATERGILVGNTPGVLTETTADLTFALMAGAARRIMEGVDYIRSGGWVTWGPKVLLGYDLHGATLGIIGFGRIGQAVARRARGFGMRILFWDTGEKAAEARELGAQRCGALGEILERSDFVSLHAPMTSGTHGLIGRRELLAMKSTAILINTARGAMVDPDALYEALESGSIAGAALDVTEPEPLPPDHRLMALPNCLIVPHVGSASHATRNRMSIMAAENLLAGIEGVVPPFPVNPEALKRRER